MNAVERARYRDVRLGYGFENPHANRIIADVRDDASASVDGASSGFPTNAAFQPTLLARTPYAPRRSTARERVRAHVAAIGKDSAGALFGRCNRRSDRSLS
jgi:hypothetical protein